MYVSVPFFFLLTIFSDFLRYGSEKRSTFMMFQVQTETAPWKVKIQVKKQNISFFSGILSFFALYLLPSI